MSTNSLLTRPHATCGTLLTSEYLLTFPFRLEQTPYVTIRKQPTCA